MSNWLSYLWYETAYWLTAPATILGYGLRTEGMQHVPRSGPVLVLANHESFLDPVLVGLAVRRHLCFLARDTLFNHPAFGWLIGSLGAAPINQDGFARQGLKTTLEQLRAGRAVLVFPEGERSADGELHALRPGVHLLIKKMKMPVLPVGIAGAYEVWPRHQKLPRLSPLFFPASKGTLAVVVGQPLDGAELAKMPRQRVLDDLFSSLQEVQQRAEQLRRKPAGLRSERNGQIVSSPQPLYHDNVRGTRIAL
jgi:1-acyl-sn-glycerol-3-phosphate acyltransferase